MKNNRTFLEKLLDGAEVEWKPLWSVTTWDKRFNAVEKEKQPKVIKYHYYLASELKPLIVDGGNVKLLTTNESDIWTTEELVQSNISEGEIIAIPWGGNPIVQYYKGKFVTADNRIATSNNTKILDNKFLYYFLLSKLDVISSFYRGSGIKHPSMYHVLEMLIPIPPEIFLFIKLAHSEKSQMLIFLKNYSKNTNRNIVILKKEISLFLPVAQ